MLKSFKKASRWLFTDTGSEQVNQDDVQPAQEMQDFKSENIENYEDWCSNHQNRDNLVQEVESYLREFSVNTEQGRYARFLLYAGSVTVNHDKAAIEMLEKVESFDDWRKQENRMTVINRLPPDKTLLKFAPVQSLCQVLPTQNNYHTYFPVQDDVTFGPVVIPMLYTKTVKKSNHYVDFLTVMKYWINRKIQIQPTDTGYKIFRIKDDTKNQYAVAQVLSIGNEVIDDAELDWVLTTDELRRLWGHGLFVNHISRSSLTQESIRHIFQPYFERIPKEYQAMVRDMVNKELENSREYWPIVDEISPLAQYELKQIMQENQSVSQSRQSSIQRPQPQRSDVIQEQLLFEFVNWTQQQQMKQARNKTRGDAQESRHLSHRKGRLAMEARQQAEAEAEAARQAEAEAETARLAEAQAEAARLAEAEAETARQAEAETARQAEAEAARLAEAEAEAARLAEAEAEAARQAAADFVNKMWIQTAEKVINPAKVHFPENHEMFIDWEQRKNEAVQAFQQDITGDVISAVQKQKQRLQSDLREWIAMYISAIEHTRHQITVDVNRECAEKLKRMQAKGKTEWMMFMYRDLLPRTNVVARIGRQHKHLTSGTANYFNQTKNELCDTINKNEKAASGRDRQDVKREVDQQRNQLINTIEEFLRQVEIERDAEIERGHSNGWEIEGLQ